MAGLAALNGMEKNEGKRRVRETLAFRGSYMSRGNDIVTCLLGSISATLFWEACLIVVHLQILFYRGGYFKTSLLWK